jgi:hypothetical protein
MRKNLSFDKNVSFYMNQSDSEALEYLMTFYNLKKSALIRKLLTEAAAVLRYKEETNYDKSI